MSVDLGRCAERSYMKGAFLPIRCMNTAKHRVNTTPYRDHETWMNACGVHARRWLKHMEQARRGREIALANQPVDAAVDAVR